MTEAGELRDADERARDGARSRRRRWATRRWRRRRRSGSIYLHYLTAGDEPEAEVIARRPGRDRGARGRRRRERAVARLADPHQRPFRGLPLSRRDGRRRADDRARPAGRRPVDGAARAAGAGDLRAARPDAGARGDRDRRTRPGRARGGPQVGGVRRSGRSRILEAMRGRFDEARVAVPAAAARRSTSSAGASTRR